MLLVMSSTKLLMYFGVTCKPSDTSATACNTYSLNTLLVIVNVLIERIDVELHARDFVDTRARNPQRLLETLEHTLAVSVRCLTASASPLTYAGQAHLVVQLTTQ
jgi:hypothetical protein